MKNKSLRFKQAAKQPLSGPAALRVKSLRFKWACGPKWSYGPKLLVHSTRRFAAPKPRSGRSRTRQNDALAMIMAGSAADSGIRLISPICTPCMRNAALNAPS